MAAFARTSLRGLTGTARSSSIRKGCSPARAPRPRRRYDSVSFSSCQSASGWPIAPRRRYTSAWGPNKKMAEQKAALLALEELGVFDPKEVDEAIEQIADQPTL